MTDIFIHSLIAWLIRWRAWLLVAGIALAAVGVMLGQKLALDRSIEHMFAADDPILEPYHQIQDAFGEHDIVLAMYSDPELTTPAGLARLEELVTKAREIPGVVAVVSLLDPPKASDFDDKERGERFRQMFVGYTHNADLNAAGISCLLEKQETGSASQRETLRQLRELISARPDGVLVGEPVLVEEAFDLLDADGRRLNTWATLLLMLTIFVCVRGLRWLVLPLVVVQMTLVVTRGLLVLLGLQMTMVSSMLAAIVTVVGVAAVLHIIVRYRDALARGLAPQDALLDAGKLLAVPVLFACLTDAFGFAALMTSSVGPVYDFGLMMAIGSLLVLVCAVLVIPGLVLIGAKPEKLEAVPSEVRLQKRLASTLDWSLAHPLLLGVVGLIATLVGIAGSARLVHETDFTRNFRQDSELVRSYKFVEDNFGGAGVWDIILPAPAQLDKQFLLRVLKLQETLKSEVPHVNSAISIADALDAGTGGIADLRFGAPLAIRGGLALMRARMPEFVGAIYRPRSPAEPGFVRIMLRSPERLDSTQKKELISQVHNVARESFPEAQVTGPYVLLTKLIDSLVRDQWMSFAVATVGIFLMMLVAFRSYWLALATLLPSALPQIWLFGAMGWLGINVNMGAAMIAAVSLGLSVDGSIHYVLSYQRERKLGASVLEALHRVQKSAGRAAVFATLALVIGFATLCVSDFVPTIYFGALVSLSMIGSLVGNLIVLPVLINLIERAAVEPAAETVLSRPEPPVIEINHAILEPEQASL